MERTTLNDVIADLRSLGLSSGPEPRLPKGVRPAADMLDRWARAAALAEPDARAAAIWAIREAAHAAGVVPASVQDLYMARGAGQWSDRTVPALNLRGWSYQTCRAVFRAAGKIGAQLLIFEQAVGEAIYAKQPPAEYTAAVLAAAMREGHTGPVFLQADHDQVNAKSYLTDPKAEIQRLSDVIRAQIAASFFNIDIDASTVVDLSLPTVVDQQRLNAELTAHFTRLIRELEPAGVTISVGAEIGEVGHHNTTPEEMRAFMATFPAGAVRRRQRRHRRQQGQRELGDLPRRQGPARWQPRADQRRLRHLARHLARLPRGIRTRRRRAARRIDAPPRAAVQIPGDRDGGDPPRAGLQQSHLRPPAPAAGGQGRNPGLRLRPPCKRAGRRRDRCAVRLQHAEEGVGRHEGALLESARGHPGGHHGVAGGYVPRHVPAHECRPHRRPRCAPHTGQGRSGALAAAHWHGC